MPELPEVINLDIEIPDGFLTKLVPQGYDINYIDKKVFVKAVVERLLKISTVGDVGGGFLANMLDGFLPYGN